MPAVAAALALLGLTGYGLHLSGHLGKWLGYAPTEEATAEPADAPEADEPTTAEAVEN